MLPKKFKKADKEAGDATRASVRKEMAEPRMAKSARIMERKLDTGHIAELPSASMPGIADKIIPSRHVRQSEKAQIAVDGAPRRHRDLRVENLLTDEHGDEVKLKRGAHVEDTVAAESKTPIAKSKKEN
jgi:hypothetical protein